MKTPGLWPNAVTKYFSSSIRNKIIIPYALLTVILAAFGAFVVTQLVAGSVEERLENQLVAAGQIVSEEIVQREQIRLQIKRAVANTVDVPETIINEEHNRLNNLVSPLIINDKNIDSIIIVNTQGKEVLSLQRTDRGFNAQIQTEINRGSDFSTLPTVSRVLSDPAGETTEVQLALDPGTNELIIFTIGAITNSDDEVIGGVLVGTFLQKEVEVLHSLALAELTLFNEDSIPIASTLVQDNIASLESVFAEFTPEFYRKVIFQGEEVTFLDEIEFVEIGSGEQAETYRIAYAPFMLRQRVQGVYGVALSTDFVTRSITQNRTLLGVVFSLGMVMVMAMGYVISQRMIRPIIRLVKVVQAIGKGDLNQRTAINRDDEIGILASAFDKMTDELQELIRIQQEEASKLNAILSSIADGVIVLSPDGEILSMNPAARDILEAMSGELGNFDQPETINLNEQDIENSESISLLSQLTQLEFHETKRFEMSQRVLSALSAPVVTPDENKLGTVVVLRDITREVESEKLKDDFITSVSHELRTPLTAIRGYNQLLMMMPLKMLEDKRIELTQKLDEQVSDLLNLIQEMLDLSQISTGTLGIDREQLNMVELIEMEAARWSDKMEMKELDYNLFLPEEPVWVTGDESRLTRVMHHLIKNSNDYTLEGKVEIYLEQANGLAQVKVNDTGVGITEEGQRYLFTRFKRAIHDKETYDVSGAGLGLYMSKAIIEAHGGNMQFHSEAYKGSSFRFSLPIYEENEESESFEEYAEEF